MQTLIDHFPGRVIHAEGRTYRYFGGTAYLGMQTLPEFQERYIEELSKYGTSYGASRKANVKLQAFEQGETALSALIGSEAALYTSSGFAACQLVRKYFGQQGHPLFFAPHTHAALKCPGDREEESLEALLENIGRCLAEHPAKAPVLVFDSVDFAGPQPLQLQWLHRLPLEEIILVADDSHALGICGIQGGGSFRLLERMKPKGLLICGSLGKGFGISGGIIAGRSEVVQTIANDPWFGGGSPGNVAGLSALSLSGDLLEARRLQLQRNIALFITHNQALDHFAWSEGYPCFTVSDNALPAYLEERGLMISNFHYPNADSPLLCRIVITASHTEEDLISLCKALNAYYENHN